MNEAATDPISPAVALAQLRRQYNLIKWLGLATAGLVGLTVIMLLFILYRLAGMQHAIRSSIGLLALLCSLPIPIVVYLLLRHYRGRLNAATRLLKEVPPARLIMHPVYELNRATAMVELRRAEPPAPGAPRLFARVERPRRGRVIRAGEPVHAYIDPTQPAGPIVLCGFQFALIGKLLPDTTGTTIRRQAIGSFLLLFIIIGCGALFAMAMFAQSALRLRDTARLARASLNWPAVTGQVVRSEVGPTRIKRGKSSVAGFEARVTYEYRGADGKLRQGRRIHFGNRPTTDRDQAARLAAGYPAGHQVRIYHAPENPDLAVLEAGHEESVRRELQGALAGGAAVLLCSLIFLAAMGLHFRQQMRKLRAALNW